MCKIKLGYYFITWFLYHFLWRKPCLKFNWSSDWTKLLLSGYSVGFVFWKSSAWAQWPAIQIEDFFRDLLSHNRVVHRIVSLNCAVVDLLPIFLPISRGDVVQRYLNIVFTVLVFVGITILKLGLGNSLNFLSVGWSDKPSRLMDEVPLWLISLEQIATRA